MPENFFQISLSGVFEPPLLLENAEDANLVLIVPVFSLSVPLKPFWLPTDSHMKKKMLKAHSLEFSDSCFVKSGKDYTKEGEKLALITL